MQKPDVPANETQRLITLRNLDLLDTLPEERFDRITRLARRVFRVPIALVSLIDAERQWFKSRQGLDVTETSREISFCGHSVASDAVLVVPDATKDNRFDDNPLVVGDPSIRFYAGYPLHAGNGAAVGTLCLIDREPRALADDELAMLRDLAAIVEDELNSLKTAATDPLTKISNRRGFELLAGKSLAVCRRLEGAATAMLFDLDGFKPINDELGHAVGDLALVDFARTLIKTFRDADVIARLGGDEFCVLATGAEASMEAPLRRLQANLAELPDRPYQLKFSVGTVEYSSERHATLEALVEDADRAMYVVKRSRRPSELPVPEDR